MNHFERIRKLAIKALFADDYLMDRLVLKGASALAYAYLLPNRASVDVDVSINGDFDELFESIENRLHEAFLRTFRDDQLVPFDMELSKVPARSRPGSSTIWGGYRFEFKVLERSKFEATKVPENRSRQALVLNSRQDRVFRIDISKFEYCNSKVTVEIDSHIIYVYTPAMIVMEKLRAICQQMTEYLQRTNRTPRARDFFDIYQTLNTPSTSFDPYTDDNLKLLREMFRIKEVPIELLKNITNYRDYHAQDWSSVEPTIDASVAKLKFDEYFDFTSDLAAKLFERLSSLDMTE